MYFSMANLPAMVRPTSFVSAPFCIAADGSREGRGTRGSSVQLGGVEGAGGDVVVAGGVTVGAEGVDGGTDAGGGTEAVALGFAVGFAVGAVGGFGGVF